MTKPAIEINDIHWLMDILQNIDVGLIVLNRDYQIQLWNGFMESHSGLSPQNAKGQDLFELFPDIPSDWFRKKAEPVFQLKTRTFTIWEQRPYLFRFKNYRPITGRATFMYQNTSVIPLESVDKSVDHICVIVYDVTDMAVEHLDAERLRQAAQSAKHPEQQRPVIQFADANQWNLSLEQSLDSADTSLLMLELRFSSRAPDQSDYRPKIESLVSNRISKSDTASWLSSHHIGLLLSHKDDRQSMDLISNLRSDLKDQFSNPDCPSLTAGVSRSKEGFPNTQAWQKSAANQLRLQR